MYTGISQTHTILCIAAYHTDLSLFKGSMVSQKTNYMPLLVHFMNSFFKFTTSDAFWGSHKTNAEFIPFTSRLDFPDKVTLDYGAFSSASELRAAEHAHIMKFRTDLSKRGSEKYWHFLCLRNVNDQWSADNL